MCVSMQDLKETILKFMKLILFLKFSISWEKDSMTDLSEQTGTWEYHF